MAKASGQYQRTVILRVASSSLLRIRGAPYYGMKCLSSKPVYFIMDIKIPAARKPKRHKISKYMIDFKTDHLLHNKEQYPIKADYYDSCHNPLYQNRNQDCHGNHKNKRCIATAAVPDKLPCICDMEYRKKSIFTALNILTAS